MKYTTQIVLVATLTIKILGFLPVGYVAGVNYKGGLSNLVSAENPGCGQHRGHGRRDCLIKL